MLTPADFGVVAMNLSLGGTTESQAEADAIAYATSKGSLVIASAGNDQTTTVSCPACDVNAVSVAATTWADKLAPYSNQGAGLDISAPGGSCYSNTTSDGCIYSAFKGGGYAWEQGPSMAAPQRWNDCTIGPAPRATLTGQGHQRRAMFVLGSNGDDPLNRR